MTHRTSTETAKLKEAVIKTTLRRYKRWLKEHGEPKPWGHPQCVQRKDSHDHLMAVHALYKALNGR